MYSVFVLLRVYFLIFKSVKSRALVITVDINSQNNNDNNLFY